MHILLLKTEVFHWTKYLTDKTQKMATIKIKQVRSKIKSPKDQKLTLEALGLKKMNAVVEHEATPQILGMVAKVKHLVEVIN